MTTYVNVYDAGRAYGGPEEGGWWFDVWSPVASMPVDLSEGETVRTLAAASGYTVAQVEAYRQEHVRYGDPEWLDFDPDVYDAVEAAVRRKAETYAEWFRNRYPRTGRRNSVIGGTDYDVRIEDHFAREGDNYRPWE